MIEALGRVAAEGTLLPVSSVLFPLAAAGIFATLAAVTWSYRDVAHRHANKTGGSRPQGPTH